MRMSDVVTMVFETSCERKYRGHSYFDVGCVGCVGIVDIDGLDRVLRRPLSRVLFSYLLYLIWLSRTSHAASLISILASVKY